ncbi:signal transduction histidine kinase, nitrogen specific, NtrB [Candidatus Omnitrophus magneticus]|uniref:histidine kinase n=1 Tax=Candidatus Omnitrophus magneticus TaxID=1609969 RepID=A0A0F0CQF2_9BACT|nr:signal transduction histidine kinase, nitrogen specific, NtrB [Candidatus Omnitrophus magneticus]
MKTLLSESIEHTPIGITIVEGGCGNVMIANSAGAKISGIKVSDSDSSMPIMEYLKKWPELFQNSTVCNLKDLPLAKAYFNKQNIEAEFIVKTSCCERTLLIASAPVLDEKGAVIAAVMIFSDITERKRLEESQRLSQLGKLASDMAHEINNPLLVVSGRAQLLSMEQNLTSSVKQNLDVIRDQCERAKNVILRMLKFSKTKAGDIKEENILDPLNLVIDILAHQFSLDNITIVKKFAKDLPLVKIDEEQMNEVFINLIKNAAESMISKGVITISTLVDNNMVRVDISDIGCGIPPEHLQRIFNPFFTTKKNGTGLGVSVSYGIIKAHGGDIKYSSIPGKGTTVSIFLPCAGK